MKTEKSFTPERKLPLARTFEDEIVVRDKKYPVQTEVMNLGNKGLQVVLKIINPDSRNQEILSQYEGHVKNLDYPKLEDFKRVEGPGGMGFKIDSEEKDILLRLGIVDEAVKQFINREAEGEAKTEQSVEIQSSPQKSTEKNVEDDESKKEKKNGNGWMDEAMKRNPSLDL